MYLQQSKDFFPFPASKITSLHGGHIRSSLRFFPNFYSNLDVRRHFSSLVNSIASIESDDTIKSVDLHIQRRQRGKNERTSYVDRRRSNEKKRLSFVWWTELSAQKCIPHSECTYCMKMRYNEEKNKQKDKQNQWLKTTFTTTWTFIWTMIYFHHHQPFWLGK